MQNINDVYAALAGTLGTTILLSVCICGVVLAGIIGIAAVFIFIIRGSVRRSREIERRSKDGIPATAVIVNSESFADKQSSRLTVQLTLDVQPPAGSVYRSTTGWSVDYLSAAQLQPGQSIAVRIDADDASIIYPDVSWAKYSGARIMKIG
jgi:hypothetical protein